MHIFSSVFSGFLIQPLIAHKVPIANDQCGARCPDLPKVL
jgi:hypothetical protein